jgi:serine/threonine protein kinase
LYTDIKPENVPLDDSFVPKIADFGLAKLFGRDFSRVLTTMRGTIGYLAPEWISGTAITAKADVFSYRYDAFRDHVREKELSLLPARNGDVLPCAGSNKTTRR